MEEISKRKFKDLYEMNMKYTVVYCALCGNPIKRMKDFSIDHLTPRSRSGLDHVTNWAPAHKECNYKKGALTLSEWQLWQELERKRHGHTK